LNSSIIGTNSPVLKGNVYTLDELNNIYTFTEDIIDHLSLEAVDQIFSGTEKDVNYLIEIILQEVSEVLCYNKGDISSASFGYLDKLTTNLDEILKRLSFNYFVCSTLPEFEVNWHHIEWGNLIQIFRKLVIIAARDHGKSFNFSLAYPLWRMYGYEKDSSKKRDRLSKRGMIITNEIGLARELLKFVKEEIESNDILREKLYPSSREGWGSEEITCRTGVNLKTKSYGSRMRGHHPGWISVDDFLDDRVLYSAELRNKFTDSFNSVVDYMLLPGGQIIVVGTPYHQADLYGKLKEAEDFKVFEYPGIFPDGRLLWENRYNWDDLMVKRKKGTIIFSREVLVKPISEESSIFPYYIVRRAFVGMEEFILSQNIHSFKRKFVKVAVGCDFGISAEVGSDYTVYIVLVVDEFDNYWLLHVYRERGAHYSRQVSMLRQIVANFHPDVVMGEDNAFQEVMIQLIEDAGVKIVRHTTGTNKFDLQKGLPGLAIVFENNRMKFPRGDQYSKDVTDVIVGELTSITWTDKKKLESVSEHDDTVYSLWIAVLAAKYITESFDFGWL